MMTYFWLWIALAMVGVTLMANLRILGYFATLLISLAFTIDGLESRYFLNTNLPSHRLIRSASTHPIMDEYSYVATVGGQYVHANRHCPNLHQEVNYTSLESASRLDRLPCPLCITRGAE